MKNSNIYKNHQLIKDHKTTYKQLVQEQLDRASESMTNNENIVLDVYPKEALALAETLDKAQDNNIFSGVTVFLKDNVNFKDHITTSGSLIFQDVISSYDATIVDNIKKHKGIILGKTNLDEFGHAGTGTWSAYGVVKNTLDPEKITGGSSSGSVSAVYADFCDFAIGSDTGDSIRHPASYVGVVGYKPSYGVVSRYGITPYASSLDHVGVIAKTVMDATIGTDMIKGYDPKDLTSVDVIDGNFCDHLEITDHKYKIVILSDVVALLDEKIKPQFNRFVEDLKSKYEVEFVDFDITLLDMIGPLYASISYFEGLTNWNNINGILFSGKGVDYNNYNDLLVKVRSNLGGEIKNRYMISNLLMNETNFDTVFENSIKIRRIIVNRVNEILDKCDAILIPSASVYAPEIEVALARKAPSNSCDDALQIANFAGLPSITIPLTSLDNKNAIGINLTSKKYEDLKVLNVAYNLEEFIKNNGYYNE